MSVKPVKLSDFDDRAFIYLHWMNNIPILRCFPFLKRFRQMQRVQFCWRCLRFTRHLDCEEDSGHGYYCLRHCTWDTEGDWEHGYQDYPICPKCEAKEQTVDC